MKKRAMKDDKFSSTEVGTLLEALKSEIKPVLEAIPDMQEKLDNIFEQVGKNTEKLAIVETAIRELSDKVGKNTEKIEENRQLITRNTGLITRNEGLITRNEGLITRVLEELKSKADRKDFEILEKKVASLTS